MSAPLTRFLLLILYGSFAGIAVWWVISQDAPDTTATLFGEQSRALPEFSLVRHDEKPLRVEDFEKRWSLLFFGYSQCPDICAPTLQQLTQALNLLGHESGQLVFVSIDPQRDNPNRLAQYVRHFHSTTLGVTGSGEEISAFSKYFGAYSAKRELDTGYLMDHSSGVWLINPEARLAGVFTTPFTPEAIAEDLRYLIAQS